MAYTYGFLTLNNGRPLIIKDHTTYTARSHIHTEGIRAGCTHLKEKIVNDPLLSHEHISCQVIPFYSVIDKRKEKQMKEPKRRKARKRENQLKRVTLSQC